MGTELLQAVKQKIDGMDGRRDEVNSRLITAAVFKYRVIHNFLTQTYGLRPLIEFLLSAGLLTTALSQLLLLQLSLITTLSLFLSLLLLVRVFPFRCPTCASHSHKDVAKFLTYVNLNILYNFCILQNYSPAAKNTLTQSVYTYYQCGHSDNMNHKPNGTAFIQSN